MFFNFNLSSNVSHKIKILTISPTFTKDTRWVSFVVYLQSDYSATGVTTSGVSGTGVLSTGVTSSVGTTFVVSSVIRIMMLGIINPTQEWSIHYSPTLAMF